jgi:hypothetical protein
MVRQKFQNVLVTEMDRKEFLKRSGVVLLGIAGVSTVSKTLLDVFSGKQSHKRAGYGTSPYGR